MPLNLLKHKSYHVGNAKNLERVRRDEEKAEAERAEKLKLQRASNIQRLRERRGVDTKQPNSKSVNETQKRDIETSDKTIHAIIDRPKASRSIDAETTKRKSKNDNYFRFKDLNPEEKRKRLKIDDEAVKQRLDPLADIIKGVEETTRYERRKKMNSRLRKKIQQSDE